MQDEFKLSSRNSSRVTYAAVFLPSADNPDQEIKYLLPEGMRGANGFETYNKFKHHRDQGKGDLCCGNCYEENKRVPVHHRAETDERIGGGAKPGTHSTWSAYPNTIDDHTEKCQQRRTAAGRAKQGQMIRWNINIPDTYDGAIPKESLYLVDPDLDKRKSKVVHQYLQELLTQVSIGTRQQAQEALYVVDSVGTLHKNMMIDGDNWKHMVQGGPQSPFQENLYKLFHVSIPTSRNIRSFADAATSKHEKTKIPCSPYIFTDDKGKAHEIHPIIETSRDDVCAVFEKSGDYFILCAMRHETKKGSHGKTIHEVHLYPRSPQLVAELYANPKRKISDYNAFHNLQMAMDEVHMLEPKRRVTFPKIKAAHPAQVDMFEAEAPLLDIRPH